MAKAEDEPWVQLATRIPKSLHRELKLHCSRRLHEGMPSDYDLSPNPATSPLRAKPSKAR